jgi:hypothetical protein
MPLELYSTFVTDDQVQALLAKPESYKKIPAEAVARGKAPALAFAGLNQVAKEFGISHVVAHNGTNYDKTLLASEYTRHGCDDVLLRRTWLDTRYDLPMAESIETRKLPYLAAEHGFLNPFPHRAVFDVMTMLRVLSQYDMQAVLDLAAQPWMTVRIVVGYDDRQAAKDLRYSWEKVGEKSYPRCWVKRIRANKLEDERKATKFPVVVLEQG